VTFPVANRNYPLPGFLTRFFTFFRPKPPPKADQKDVRTRRKARAPTNPTRNIINEQEETPRPDESKKTEKEQKVTLQPLSQSAIGLRSFETVF
jgi:hypothetical protein